MYGYLRILVIPIAALIWLFFQFMIKKRKWSELRTDIGAVAFIIAVYGIVYLVLLR